MFKPTYLYVKTHNITGLKYFGKTTAKDPCKYKGSGVYWTRHIEKHGYNVVTEIIGLYTNEQECYDIALKFSIDNNIVKSTNWANLKEESLDGGWDYINSNGLNIVPREIWSEQGLENRHNGCVKSGVKARDLKLGIHALTPEQNKENRLLAQEAVFEKYGVKYIFSVLNKDTEFKEKQRNSLKVGHQQGEKNSQFGKKWTSIHNDNTREKIRIPEGMSIPEGWEIGWMFDLHLKEMAKEQRILERKEQKKIEFTEYLKIYEEFGFKKFVEITGFPRTQSTFCVQLGKYLDDYVPKRSIISNKERKVNK